MAPPKRAKGATRSQQASKNSMSLGLMSLGAIIALVAIAYFVLRDKDKVETSPEAKIKEELIAPVKVCKLFLENSGSMDGYVQPVNSQMKTDLNALISNISCDSLSLNYINSSIIPIKAKRVSDFVEGLSVQSFRQGGGQRSSTSLQELLRTVYDNTATGEVSILVSDMILDLRSGQSPESVSINIETDLRQQLERRPDWSIVLWRMNADYEGKYYHSSGVKPVSLSGVKRPYYIIFVGDRQDLRSILGEGRLPQNMPLWRNRLHSLSLEPAYEAVRYHISPVATLGEIQLDPQDRSSHTIAEAERGTSPDGKQGLAFELVVDRPTLLQSTSSLLDASRYTLKPSSYRIEQVREDKQGKSIIIRLGGDAVVRGEVSLHYMQTIPSWLSSVHSEQNNDIRAEGAMEQTYGIRYILEGLCRPYESKAQYLFTLPIRIN